MERYLLINTEREIQSLILCICRGSDDLYLCTQRHYGEIVPFVCRYAKFVLR